MNRLTRFSKWNNGIPVGEGAMLSHRDLEWKAVQKRKRQPASLLPCCTALPFLYSICELHKFLTGQAPRQQVTNSNVDEDRQQCWVCCADEINWRRSRAEQGSSTPIQELPVEELLAAFWGGQDTWVDTLTFTHTHNVLTVSLISSPCCAGHSPIKASFHCIMD